MIVSSVFTIYMGTNGITDYLYISFNSCTFNDTSYIKHQKEK